MNIAKMSVNGQLTVPVAIRRKLGLREGSRLLFVESADGDVIIANAATAAIVQAQKAFSGAAGDFGVSNADEVQALVDEVRYGKERT